MDINNFIQSMFLLNSYQLINPFLFPTHQPAPPVSSQKKYSRVWRKREVEEMLAKTLKYCQESNKKIEDLILSDFEKIGKDCPQTPEQVMIKMNEVNQSGTLRPGIWSNSEDELLSQLVERKEKWVKIANLINNGIHNQLKIRSGKQCKERWNNYLNPSINRGQWTTEEDVEILRGYKEHGKKWSLIARNLQNRTESSVKNRVKSLLNKIRQDLSSIADLDSGISGYISKCLKNEPSSKDDSS